MVGLLLVQWRCRVHALNILRLVILDAPLAKDMRCFVGDAIISALLGYDDEDWAVRNSSTMVFASAMLRVVDADKNAAKLSKLDSSKVSYFVVYACIPSCSSWCLLNAMHQCKLVLF